MVDEATGGVVKVDLDRHLLKPLAGTGEMFCYDSPEYVRDMGTPKRLKIDCECRKPKPGMILRAAKDYNIDLCDSWMVGDSEIDILAGKNAGCKTALICSDGADVAGDEMPTDGCKDVADFGVAGDDRGLLFGADIVVRNLLVFVICVLSFQNGTQTKAMSTGGAALHVF